MTRTKHLWIVPLVIAALVAFVGWWANLEVRNTIEREVAEDLVGTLEANVTALEIWMANQKRIAASLAEDPRLRETALELLERSAATPTNRPLDVGRQPFGAERFQERLQVLGYDFAQVIGTNFLVVADSFRGGRLRAVPVAEELRPRFMELFDQGKPILVTPFKVQPPGRRGGPGRGAFDPLRRGNGPSRGSRFGRGGRIIEREWTNLPPALAWLRSDSIMQVAAPIKDENGITRGAFSLLIRPDMEFTRILTVAQSGTSGETIAFDPDGLLISRSRFEDDLKQWGLMDSTNASSALNMHLTDPGGDLSEGFNPGIAETNRPLIRMVSRALSGDPGVELQPFRDYRGVPVVAAWRWLADYDFGVGTKVDAKDAYRPLRVVRSVFIVLFLLLVLTALVVFLFTYLQVVWRRRVTEAELKARQLGQYKLEQKIGEGGMGVVYRAHHALLRRDTALKLLPPDKADPVAINRFEREVRLTCRLTHPNTIQVYDYGHTPDGIFYYAMEYLDGLNLNDLIERYGALPEERVMHVLAQVCDSLAEAHALGLIHRDIKPANIFVCDRGGVPDCVKVLDFGLVKHLGDPNATSLTGNEIGQIVGTPQFIAPETLRHPAQNDPRSDIYSLGALGYFLLTGNYVFTGGTVVEICQKHMTEPPIAPSARLGATVDPEFESLLLRCLEKDPAARPQSAAELADLLRASPRLRLWTLARRSAWWAEHREATRQAQAQAEMRPPSESPPTVKIAMSDRTL
jgi:hypothetical protein